MKKGLTGEVGDEERARLPLPAKRAGAEPTLFVSAERDTVVLHLDHFGASFAAHDFDGVLVSEVVGAFYGVVGVIAPVVAGVFESGVDASLCSVGVASDGMDFGYDGHVRTVLAGGESGAHPSQSSADYEHVMGVHQTHLSGIGFRNEDSIRRWEGLGAGGLAATEDVAASGAGLGGILDGGEVPLYYPVKHGTGVDCAAEPAEEREAAPDEASSMGEGRAAVGGFFESELFFGEVERAFEVPERD